MMLGTVTLATHFRRGIRQITGKIVRFSVAERIAGDRLSQTPSHLPATAPSGIGENRGPALEATAFCGSLAPHHWRIRQSRPRCARLLLVSSGHGVAMLRGTSIAFGDPAALWLPGDVEGELRTDAGARGFLVAISEEMLTQTIAASAEALHLRRALDSFMLLDAERIAPALQALQQSCTMLVDELRMPRPGDATLCAAHILLICLHLWRCSATEETTSETVLRGDGARLVGDFLQLVELHFRQGWPVSRYAAALRVTTDRLHAHCKRQKGASPLALIHARLAQEARTRLLQLDLPVEQIGYGLGFRDPGYFSRFFRKHQGLSPGVYRRRARLEQARREPSFAAWP